MNANEYLKISTRERRLLKRALNEVANGITLPNRELLVGLSRGDLVRWLDDLRSLPKGTDTDISTDQVLLFYRILRVTIQSLTRVNTEEFHIRTDFAADEANEILQRLKSWLVARGISE